ncbi:MAG: Mss4p nuclear export [Piccolia ochrophora]|nr:MAG: Mss4p nuclear export [Piccolia ochrophora]
MAKRKQHGEKAPPPDGSGKGKASGGSDDASSNEEDTDMLNVDFEWFDPQPEHDFHGLKILLRQLFDADAQLLDLSALTDLILSQPLLGSTVKVDGNESDPYAFLTVLNLHEHREKAVIKQLNSYILDRSSTDPTLAGLRDHLLPDSSSRIGLILTERLINIPPEVIPPMYTMLLEEITWANDEKEPYQFSHYLVISKTYTEVMSSLDSGDGRPQKKSKRAQSEAQTFFFHPEDEVLQRHALLHGQFDYKLEGSEGASDSKRAFQEFGVKPQGHMLLLEASKFSPAVQAVKEFVSPTPGT